MDIQTALDSISDEVVKTTMFYPNDGALEDQQQQQQQSRAPTDAGAGNGSS
jgi:hypothetical protein